MQLQTFERIRGDSKPIEWVLERDDGGVFDPTGYTWFMTAKPEPTAVLSRVIEATETAVYSMGPIAGAWDAVAGLARFSPTEADWLKLTAGSDYRVEMIGLDANGIPGVKEQFVLKIFGRVDTTD